MWMGLRGYRSLLCQSKDEEPNINVVLFYFGHGIKMYRDRRSDGLKEKRTMQDDSVDRLNLSERGKHEYHRERQSITAIPRRMCVAVGITKVSPRIFVFKRTDYSTFFYSDRRKESAK